MSMLNIMREQGAMPKKTILYYWDIVESFGDSTVRHVITFDMPVNGGSIETDTLPQLMCTREEVNLEDSNMGIRGFGRRTDYELINEVSCDECREKLTEALTFSGALEE